MTLFAERFLEPLSNEVIPPDVKWGWEPANPNARGIYASGASTNSRSSTYSSEKDDRQDEDRPNEGRFH